MKTPLKFTVVDDVLRIEIDINILARWANSTLEQEHMLSSRYEEGKLPDRVIDNTKFAKAIIRQLKKEGDDGSTRFTDLLDKMTIAVFEDGDDSISYEE